MNLINGLQELGFTEYEARVYLAILASPGAIGYEAAKHSGVPRAKVYEVLDSLVLKGALLTSQEGDRIRYHPLPYNTLLKRHLDRAERVTQMLDRLLGQHAKPDTSAPLLTMKGPEAILARAAEVVENTQHRLFISGYPAELHHLAPHIKEAEARGVISYVILFGEADLDLSRTYHHAVPEQEGRVLEGIPHLVLVGDHTEAILSDLQSALYTRNPVVAMIAAEYVKHEVYFMEVNRLYGHKINWHDPELVALQKMWFR